MTIFTPWLEVDSIGEKNAGASPHGSVSVLSNGVTGVVGVFSGGVFNPHADGAIAPGEMFTFDVGAGREIGIDVTGGTGSISIAKV